MDDEGEGVETAVNWSTVGVWAATAAGGFVLLLLYLRYGGAKQPKGASRIGLQRIRAHLVLGLVGLALWIFYAVSDTEWSAWAALGLLVLTLALGGSMLLTKDRYRAEMLRTGGAPTAGGESAASAIPAEQRYPMWLHAGHGGLGIATLVLVLLNRAGAFS